jgi:two-component system LytT family response regulator
MISLHSQPWFEKTLGSFFEIREGEAGASTHALPIRVLVSEPDAVSRRLICSLLECESGITATCVDDSRLVSSIQESAPDLVILDAYTPAVRRAPNWEAVGIKRAPATIVTAYDASAMPAFASSAIDILIKPFDAERFQSSLYLARSRIAGVRMELGLQEMSSDQEQPQPARRFLQRLAVEADERIVLVRVDDIRWMQSSGNHIRLHLSSKTSYLIRQSMKHLQTLLDPNRFLRVHRNAIVNLDYVEEFHLPPTGNMFVKMNDGLCLPLRKANRALLRRLLKDIS